MHAPGHTIFVECVTGPGKAVQDIADEWKFSAETANSANEINIANDFVSDGHVSDEVNENIEKVKKPPERRKKIKKLTVANAKKKSTSHKTDVNETFQ